MQIAVLGTGAVARAVAGRLVEIGHTVCLGTRDPDRTRDRTPDSPLPLATFAAAAAGADLVINATAGAASLAALDLAGSHNLADKVLIDISNPLDFSAGFPPTLLVKDTDCLGEQIQRAFPRTRVVKTLNTVTAELMVHPELLGSPTSVFVSGDDAEAKRTVTDLLHALGHTDVIDLGDITTARGTEMWLPLWLRLMGALGTARFNLAIIR